MFGRRPSAATPLDGVDTLLCDLDGVIYAGADAIPGAVDALTKVSRQAQIGYLTNNASRTTEHVAAHLVELGLPARPEDVVSSPQAAVRILQERLPAAAPVLVIGGEGLREVVTGAGFAVVTSADDRPAAVVQGFSPTLGWSDLAEASFALRGTDVLWVATNMDWTIPVARGIAPGNGTLVSAVHTAAGRMPDAVAGKPETALFELARERFGSRTALMVGDRLDTDIAGAVKSGMKSALVLTGIDRPKQLLAARETERPDFIVGSLAELLEPYPAVQQLRSGWSSADATVAVDGVDVRIVRRGTNPLDLLRAACAAIWNAEHSIHALRVPEQLVADPWC